MDSYIGEIKIFAGNFAPRGWALCDGQLLPIAQHTALFSILRTYYGGDGKTNFALPDLSEKAAMHYGTGAELSPRSVGEEGGDSSVTLTVDQMPSHSHTLGSQSTADQQSPNGAVWADAKGSRTSTPKVYTEHEPDIAMNPQALQPTGGNQPHNNMQPYLGLSFIICLVGEYPPHS